MPAGEKSTEPTALPSLREMMSSFCLSWDARSIFFFFSRGRRHTRFSRDWSSDVCSSDLGGQGAVRHAEGRPGVQVPLRGGAAGDRETSPDPRVTRTSPPRRSPPEPASPQLGLQEPARGQDAPILPRKNDPLELRQVRGREEARPCVAVLVELQRETEGDRATI